MLASQINAAFNSEAVAEDGHPPKAIVLAIDGAAESDNAVVCASQIADRTGARIHVVSVSEPVPIAALAIPPFLGDLSLPAIVPPIDIEAAKSAQLKSVRDQLTRATVSSAEWTVAMRSGFMGSEVADFASSLNADAIICGRSKHGILDRLLGEEHLLRLLRSTRVPVLAVESSLKLPARRAAIAVDFSEHSVAGARAALPFMAEDATVYLVHVKPDPPFGIPHPGNWLRSYEDGVREGLRHFQEHIKFPQAMSVEPIVIHGHPGVALAEFARASRSELLVVGSQGSGFWNRLVVGAVTTYLLRAESCSLLIVPSR